MSKLQQTITVKADKCAGEKLCPLNQIQVGTVVCIKQLTASPETSDRLRELGFCEQQRIKLLSKHTNLICLVCNSRLGISDKLAGSILVEAVTD